MKAKKYTILHKIIWISHIISIPKELQVAQSHNLTKIISTIIRLHALMTLLNYFVCLLILLRNSVFPALQLDLSHYYSSVKNLFKYYWMCLAFHSYHILSFCKYCYQSQDSSWFDDIFHQISPHHRAFNQDLAVSNSLILTCTVVLFYLGRRG